jgi:hypothetical protein
MFVPGYDNGQALHGRWAYKEAWMPGPWFNNMDFGWDVGAILLWPDATGQRIADVLGSNGIIFNASAEQDNYQFGYPFNLNNGETLHFSNGRSGWRGIFDPRRMYIRSDFQRGAAGAPWIVGLGWADITWQDVKIEHVCNPHS